MVRAKFRLNSYTTTMYGMSVPGTNPVRIENKELRTLEFSPVYSDDPNSENRKFWTASPQGSIKLGTVNPEAWEKFELGKDYYIDFTPAA